MNYLTEEEIMLIHSLMGNNDDEEQAGVKVTEKFGYAC